MAADVIRHLSALARESPFPTQKDQAVRALGALLHTRHLAESARGELARIVVEQATSELRTSNVAGKLLFSSGGCMGASGRPLLALQRCPNRQRICQGSGRATLV